jgi:radical S-adenosyl methionine domain-containing protein 2
MNAHLNPPTPQLPPTVNLHIYPRCNMRCRYCYAHFLQERSVAPLATKHLVSLMAQLTKAGVRRVTFAGGEPTLHPQLLLLLREAGKRSLVASLVTNGSLIDEAWLKRHGPYLRWITLSIDSTDGATARAIGRHAGPHDYCHPMHVLHVADLVHAWNTVRPASRRIHLKLNVTVTASNAHEDLRAFLLAMRPEKVKLLQMLRVEGENDVASDLTCAPESFAAYVTRTRQVELDGLTIVVEDNELMDGSYAMVDPLGRFYQRVDGRYVRSEPVHEVGLETAWSQVGGYSPTKFRDRGGEYDPGLPATGNLPYLIAVEGLDGTGKSTTVRALAARLGAAIVCNPPLELAAERVAADAGETMVRRRWYLHANRVAARQANLARASGQPVVMDRSVASTLAFGAAERGEPVGEWPRDIPRPDLLAVLVVSDEERKRRIQARVGTRTKEEDRLGRDHTFRRRVLDSYWTLGGVQIDASGPVDEVVEKLLDVARRSTSDIGNASHRNETDCDDARGMGMGDRHE